MGAMSYVYGLLTMVALCAFWALFQSWLFRHDPDAERRASKCEGCNCSTPCEDSADKAT